MYDLEESSYLHQIHQLEAEVLYLKQENLRLLNLLQKKKK